MTKTITTNQLQQNLPALLDAQEPTIIEADGQPVAALVPIEEWQAYQRYLEEKRERYKRFEVLQQMAAENAAHNNLTEEEAIELVNSIRAEMREEKRMRATAHKES